MYTMGLQATYLLHIHFSHDFLGLKHPTSLTGLDSHEPALGIMIGLKRRCGLPVPGWLFPCVQIVLVMASDIMALAS